MVSVAVQKAIEKEKRCRAVVEARIPVARALVRIIGKTISPHLRGYVSKKTGEVVISGSGKWPRNQYVGNTICDFWIDDIKRTIEVRSGAGGFAGWEAIVAKALAEIGLSYKVIGYMQQSSLHEYV